MGRHHHRKHLFGNNGRHPFTVGRSDARRFMSPTTDDGVTDDVADVADVPIQQQFRTNSVVVVVVVVQRDVGLSSF